MIDSLCMLRGDIHPVTPVVSPWRAPIPHLGAGWPMVLFSNATFLASEEGLRRSWSRGRVQFTVQGQGVKGPRGQKLARGKTVQKGTQQNPRVPAVASGCCAGQGESPSVSGQKRSPACLVAGRRPVISGRKNRVRAAHLPSLLADGWCVGGCACGHFPALLAQMFRAHRRGFKSKRVMRSG